MPNNSALLTMQLLLKLTAKNWMIFSTTWEYLLKIANTTGHHFWGSHAQGTRHLAVHGTMGLAWLDTAILEWVRLFFLHFIALHWGDPLPGTYTWMSYGTTDYSQPGKWFTADYGSEAVLCQKSEFLYLSNVPCARCYNGYDGQWPSSDPFKAPSLKRTSSPSYRQRVYELKYMNLLAILVEETASIWGNMAVLWREKE